MAILGGGVNAQLFLQLTRPAGRPARGPDRQHRGAIADGVETGCGRGHRLFHHVVRAHRTPLPTGRRHRDQHPWIDGIHRTGVQNLRNRCPSAVLRRGGRGQHGPGRTAHHLAQGDSVDRRAFLQQHVRRRVGPHRFAAAPGRPPSSRAPSTWSATRRWSPSPPATTSRPSSFPTSRRRNKCGKAGGRNWPPTRRLPPAPDAAGWGCTPWSASWPAPLGQPSTGRRASCGWWRTPEDRD